MKFSFDFWHVEREKHRLAVLAGLRARPRQHEKLQSLLDDLAAATRKEEGCVCYIPHQSMQDPELFTIYQVWTDDGFLEAHAKTQHAQYFGAAARQLLEGPVLLTRWKIMG